MNTDSKHQQRMWPWIVGAGIVTAVVSALGYVLQLDPIREEVIHTDSEGPWSARIIAVGRWSEGSLAWSSPRRLDVEFVGPSKQVERSRTNFGDSSTETQRARAYVRQELVRRARD